MEPKRSKVIHSQLSTTLMTIHIMIRTYPAGREYSEAMRSLSSLEGQTVDIIEKLERLEELQ